MQQAGEVTRIPPNGVSPEKTPTVQQLKKQANKPYTLATLPKEVWDVIAGNLPPADKKMARMVAKSSLEAIQLPENIDVLRKLGQGVNRQNLAAYMLRYQNAKLNIDIIINNKEDLVAILAGRGGIPEGSQINKLAIRCDIDSEKVRKLLAKLKSVDEVCIYLDSLALPALTAIIGSMADKKTKHLEVYGSFTQQKVKQFIEAIEISEEMKHNLASVNLSKLCLYLRGSTCSDILPIGNFTPNVTSLFLDFDIYGEQKVLETLSVMLPRLKDLTTHHWIRGKPSDVSLFLAIFSAGKQLESLELQISGLADDIFLRALREASDEQCVLPQLQELKMRYGFADPKGAVLSWVMSMAPNLSKCEVSTNIHKIDCQRIFANKDNLPIKDLDLYSLSKIGLPGLVFICKACPRLRALKLPSIDDNFSETEELLDEASQKILQISGAKLRNLSCSMSFNNSPGLLKFLSWCENLNSLNLEMDLFNPYGDNIYLQFIESITHNPGLQKVLAKLKHVILYVRSSKRCIIKEFIGYLKDGVVLELRNCEIPPAELSNRNGAITVKYLRLINCL